MPRPWSVTRTVTSDGDTAPLIRTGASRGENLIAFSIRFENTRSSCAASARTSGRSVRERELDRMVGLQLRDGRRNGVVQVAPVALRSDRARLDPRQVEQIVHQLGQPHTLGLDHVDQLGALALGDAAAAQRRAGGRDRGQRRAQVVRDRVQDRRPGHIGALRGLRLGGAARRRWSRSTATSTSRPSGSASAELVGRPGCCRPPRKATPAGLGRQAHRDLVAAAARAPARARVVRDWPRSRSPRDRRCSGAGTRRCDPRGSPTRPRRAALPRARARPRSARGSLPRRRAAAQPPRGARQPLPQSAARSAATRSCECAIESWWRGVM